MYYDESVQEVYKRLGVSEKGLNQNEVEKSKKINGRNYISPPKGKTLFKRIIEALTEPMVIILVFAWVVTFGINLGRVLKGGDGSFYECIGILLAISISVVLTIVMEGKSQKAFELLKGLGSKVAIRVIRSNKIQIISQSELVVGDIVLLEVGDKIFADGRLIETNNLQTDESMLTGESLHIDKQCENKLYKNVPLAERTNMVYSGTFVLGGSGKYVVTAVGEKAESGKIAEGLNDKEVISAPLKEKLARLGKMVSIMGIVSALFVFTLSLVRLILLNQATFEQVENIFIESIILIVAAVPEGLPTTVAISLTLNVLRLAKSNALIKKLVATETVGCVSVICSDKTGTLTQNKMVLENIVTPNRKFDGNKFNDRNIILNIAINSTADITKENAVGSKTETALLEALKRNGIDYFSLRNLAEIEEVEPFSSDTKIMKTTARIEGELIEFIKGAPEIIINKYLDEKEALKTLKQVALYQSQAKRVIAFATVKMGMPSFSGFAVLDDKLREEAVSSVTACIQAGIKVKILTGDNSETAQAVAKKLGIFNSQSKVVSGDYIDKLSDEQLKSEIEYISVVARSTPNIKLRVVKALQSIGEVVAVTGDGVNDAPAIKVSDIGIAMGDGSEITKEASDIILMDNSFATIVKAIVFGRNVFRNFQRFITFQLTVNLSSMAIIIANLLMGLPSPFSSTCLLWLNIIMDGPLALSLALEKNSEKFLEQKPVSRSENILSFKIILRITLHAVYTCLIVALQQCFNFLNCELNQQKTVVFAMFIVFQLFNAINCREVRSASAIKGLFKNKLLPSMIAVTFLVQVIFTEFIPSFFSTTSLSFILWLKITLIASTVVVFSEIYKFVYRLLLNKKHKTVKNTTKSAINI